MKILVAIKEVPDGEGGFRINEADAHALETALCLKDAGCGRVVAVTAGPERAVAILTRALALGADRAVFLSAGGAPPPSGLVLARALAGIVREEAPDLILCGVASGDNGSGRVGPMLAALLDFPWTGCVTDLRLCPGGRSVRAVREVEGGKRLAFTMDLPALATIQTSARTLRYPTLSRMLAANKAEIPRLDIASLCPGEPLEEILSADPPARRPAGEMLSGAAPEKAERLAAILRERGFL